MLQRREFLTPYLCSQSYRADYPSAQRAPAKKVRKRKHKKAAGLNNAGEAGHVSTEMNLQLEELGLPSTFGTSKASIAVSVTSFLGFGTCILCLQQQGLQGEIYKEDDSCMAVESTEPELDSPQVMRTDATDNSGIEWQQALDPTYGCFYYYRESTQVRFINCTCKSCKFA